MGNKLKRNIPAQKVDHEGSFILMPRALLRSPAMLSLSYRARSALLVLFSGFNGHNNGKIGLSIKDLGIALGNQNHKANSAALAELQSHGIIECVARDNYQQSKAREYRLTFIQTGRTPFVPATNEWKLWSRGDGKFDTEGATSSRRKFPNITAARRKLSVDSDTTLNTETCGEEGRFRVATIAAHISTSARSSDLPEVEVGNSLRSASELRDTINRMIEGRLITAASVAEAIGMPQGTMSKFRNGKNLPKRFHSNLQMELGRRDAFTAMAVDSKR
jgi:predicted XRE-type DNA-binding protein